MVKTASRAAVSTEAMIAATMAVKTEWVIDPTRAAAKAAVSI